MSEIWKALLEVQKEAPTLQRDGLNPHFKSSYVTLETVMQTVLPILNRHGVVLVQTTTQADHLLTKLVHAESGETETSVMRLVMSRDDAQGYGSAMTYARRYAVMGMLGLVADADDDGNAASKPPVTRSKTKAQPAPTPTLPTSWDELQTAMEPYGVQVWDDFRGLGAQTRTALFPDQEKEGLNAEQKQELFNVALAAAQWLMVKFDPEKFPPPSREELADAWAFALGGPVVIASNANVIGVAVAVGVILGAGAVLVTLWLLSSRDVQGWLAMSFPTWVVTIVTPEPNSDIERQDYFQIDKRILADLPSMLEAFEEDLTDLLPEGYSAKIVKVHVDEA